MPASGNSMTLAFPQVPHVHETSPKLGVYGGRLISWAEWRSTYDFVVRIHVGGTGYCSGVVWHKYVITCAHCVVDKNFLFTVLTVEQTPYRARYLKHNVWWQGVFGANRETAETAAYDVAILKMVDGTQFVNRAPVKFKFCGLLGNGARLSVAGMGTVSPGVWSERPVTIERQPVVPCNPAFEGAVCVAMPQGQTCKGGDSGAPWFLWKDGQPIVVGIHSGEDDQTDIQFRMVVAPLWLFSTQVLLREPIVELPLETPFP